MSLILPCGLEAVAFNGSAHSGVDRASAVDEGTWQVARELATA